MLPPTTAPVSRSRLRVLVAVLTATVSTATLPAQTTASLPEDEAVELQEFTVTGTNIRRTEQESILPVSVLDTIELDLRATNTAADLFELLPQAGETTINESSSLGADARGDVNSIALRSLGSGNTLILLNGRRLPPHSISQNDGGTPSLSVNVNVIPSAAIDRLEILRDGASAVYGSDAAAGVVNTILERDIVGKQLRLRIGDSEHNDLREYRAIFSMGERFNGGDTRLGVIAEFYNRERLPTRKREFSADADMRRLAPPPWNGVVVEGVVPSRTNPDNDFDNSSTSSRFGNFRRGVINPDNSFTGARPTGNRGIVTTQPNPPSTTATMSTAGLFFFVPREAGGVGFRSTTPTRDLGTVESDYYQNLNEYRTHYPYTDRKSLYVSFDHTINDALSAFADVVYYDSFSETRREPTAITDASDNNLYIPRTNFYNPFGERFYHPTGAPNADGTPRILGDPADILIVNHSNDATGPRIIEVDTDMLRLVGGLRGRFAGTWEWESAALLSKSTTRDRERNALRESRMREALARSGPDAYNVLGYTFRNVGGIITIDQPYANPESVLDFLRDDFLRDGETALNSWDFRANGDLFSLPAGPVKAAVGLEFRRESYIDFRPPYHGENPLDDPNPFLPGQVDEGKPDNDFIALSPNFNVDTDRTMWAAFAELHVPITGPEQGIPLLRRLELQLAGRFEDYSDFGDTTKPKIGLSWYPVRQVLLRGSYNESFRAPNLAQLFPGTLVRSVTNVSDPYRFQVTNLTTDGARNRIAFRSGNENLTPELAETRTAGIVVDVPWVDGLSLSADWWKLEQRDAFNIFGLSEILRQDRDLLDAETQRQLAAGTPIANVVLQTATTYAGSPLVVRRPITAADEALFATYNASRPVADQRGPVGDFLRGFDDYFNISGRRLEGWDFSVRYRVPRNALGRFTLSGEGAYTKTWEEQILPVDPYQNERWRNGKPLWKWNAGLAWRRESWTAGVFANYIGTYEDTSALISGSAVRAALLPLPYVSGNNLLIVDSWLTFNTYVGFEVGKDRGLFSDLTLRLGCNNVLDEDPPLIDESRGFAVGTANPRGRSYYLDIRKRW